MGATERVQVCEGVRGVGEARLGKRRKEKEKRGGAGG